MLTDRSIKRKGYDPTTKKSIGGRVSVPKSTAINQNSNWYDYIRVQNSEMPIPEPRNIVQAQQAQLLAYQRRNFTLNPLTMSKSLIRILNLLINIPKIVGNKILLKHNGTFETERKMVKDILKMSRSKIMAILQYLQQHPLPSSVDNMEVIKILNKSVMSAPARDTDLSYAMPDTRQTSQPDPITLKQAGIEPDDPKIHIPETELFEPIQESGVMPEQINIFETGLVIASNEYNKITQMAATIYEEYGPYKVKKPGTQYFYVTEHADKYYLFLGPLEKVKNREWYFKIGEETNIAVQDQMNYKGKSISFPVIFKKTLAKLLKGIFPTEEEWKAVIQSGEFTLEKEDKKLKTGEESLKS